MNAITMISKIMMLLTSTRKCVIVISVVINIIIVDFNQADYPFILKVIYFQLTAFKMFMQMQ